MVKYWKFTLQWLVCVITHALEFHLYDHIMPCSFMWQCQSYFFYSIIDFFQDLCTNVIALQPDESSYYICNYINFLLLSHKFSWHVYVIDLYRLIVYAEEILVCVGKVKWVCYYITCLLYYWFNTLRTLFQLKLLG